MVEDLRNVQLKKFYDSDKDDILKEFFIPTLSVSTSYKRLAGFFSSTVLATAARGLSKFILNGGKMELVIGAHLSKDDFEVVRSSSEKRNEFISNFVIHELENIDSMLLDNVKALGWMLKNNLLELKIAIVSNKGIFHQKVGIFEDNKGNRISFSGSDNETGSAWKYNIEEFKVFRSWIPEEVDWFKSDLEKFNRFWSNNSKKAIVMNAPEAIRKKLISISPNSVNDLKIVEGEIVDNKEKTSTSQDSRLKLRSYQISAVEKWIKNGSKGIFEMATGTGKTITALGAAERISKENGRICVIISVPYKHLATQWKKVIEKQIPDSIIVEAYSGVADWKKKLNSRLKYYRDNLVKKLFIVSLYSTSSTTDFIDIINKNHNQKNSYLIIADEMHNLGAPSLSKGMLDIYNKRLGLSATPTRHFDEIGTKTLEKYFDRVVFKYSLRKAITDGLLTPYEYYPVFVTLDDQEFQKYLDYSRKILFSKKAENDEKAEEYLRMLLIKRSKIIKSSKNKLVEFKKIMESISKNEGIDHLLVYCDSGGQLIEAQKIINELGIINHKFTQIESLSERNQIIDDFDKGVYDCLAAVKCLDEGVDIPSIKTAVILASSSNPREYIQRRGRVLRKYKGKESAKIYDFCVLPPNLIEDSHLREIEKGILKKELHRIQDFLDTAENKAYTMNILTDIMMKYNVFFD